jgi:hypothetical protein
MFMEDVVRAHLLGDEQKMQGILKSDSPIDYQEAFWGRDGSERFHIKATYHPETKQFSGVLKDNTQNKELEFKFAMDHFLGRK